MTTLINNNNLIPDDPRIANRPGNPNWQGVGAWFDKAAGIEPVKPLVTLPAPPAVTVSDVPAYLRRIYVCSAPNPAAVGGYRCRVITFMGDKTRVQFLKGYVATVPTNALQSEAHQ